MLKALRRPSVGVRVQPTSWLLGTKTATTTGTTCPLAMLDLAEHGKAGKTPQPHPEWRIQLRSRGS